MKNQVPEKQGSKIGNRNPITSKLEEEKPTSRDQKALANGTSCLLDGGIYRGN